MPENYQDLVLNTYKRKRDNGELYLILPKETTAKLKKACLKVYDSRYTALDADILSMYFNVDKMGCDFREIITKSEPDDFKTLLNHIKEITESTDEKNSELLAWLVDFKPRPSIQYYKSFQEESMKSAGSPDSKEGKKEKPEEKTGSDIEGQKGENEGGEIDPKDKTIFQFTFLNIFTITIIFLLLEAGALFLWRNYTDQISVPSADEKCMYWVGTHYEPIKCGELKDGTPVVPLDAKKLNTFKKIYLSDTLTQKSIGHVWYSNVGKKHEFFTDSGMHPVDTVKRLRPLTAYILTKHTSSHRFLVNVITMASCSIVVAVLFAFGCIYLRRKLKRKLLVKTD